MNTINTIIVGDVEKHDLVLMLAKLIHFYTDQEVTIITDEDRNYQYLNGEITGVYIDVEVANHKTEFVLYDYHYSIPAVKGNIVLVTSFEKRAIEAINTMLTGAKEAEINKLILVQQDCSLNSKFVRQNLNTDVEMVGYYDSPRRRIDWIHDMRINLKSVENDFKVIVEDLFRHITNAEEKEMKKLWAYARKRG